MKQLLQNLSNGETTVIEAPAPAASAGMVVVNGAVSLISAGTERMLVDFGKGGLVSKARQQPEKVKMVFEKVQAEGLGATVESIRSKLAEPVSMGYSHVGVVSSVGEGVHGIVAGDRVVSNGPHADVVRVPRNLCARIPDEVSDEEAAFTVVASIGLQGIRLAQPTLGESFVVTGVGLIGLLTVQLLRAHGCRVLAVDFDERKLALARAFGAETLNAGKGEDPVAAGMAFSRGHGVDGVLITASTKSNDPVTQAARMSRKRGRIVLVGVVGLELNRADFYEKELSFQVSCSYGPGRYDPAYEEMGNDYPLGFVRWTEQRNFEAVLDMMAGGQLDVKPLISHRFAFEDAPKAYETLGRERNVLGVLLEYSGEEGDRHSKLSALREDPRFDATRPVVSFIGAGNYASRVLIPAFRKSGAQLHTVVTSGGVSGVIHGKKAGFAQASTDVEAMLVNDEVQVVAVVSRHNTHAAFVIRALEAGKHVFVEKPLALTEEELALVAVAYKAAATRGNSRHLMVGFNRRFAPQVLKMKRLLNEVREPKVMVMTVNAGEIPPNHWTQDRQVGGGRIIGEACHFIDLLRHLSGQSILSWHVSGTGTKTKDTVSIQLCFEDGSMGTVHYLANGSKAFPKERLEVFVAGRVLQLDNFRKLRGWGWKGFKAMNLWSQDKGQQACVTTFLDAIETGKPTPISFDEIEEVSRITIQIAARA